MTRKTLSALGGALILTLGLVASTGPGWSQPARGGGRGGAPAAVPAPAPTGKAPVVGVAGGQVQGDLYSDIAVYRGIPYAAAPVGNLRWRAPQPVRAWPGVRDASAYGRTCAAPPEGAEDCLFVNVSKPANAKAGDRLPVMFWIHGGGFTGGSGALDATPFVKKGVVFVSINYRMGRLGWFAHPAITRNAPAGENLYNYGLQDQLAALRWTQANVAAFGGDPNNVTVFGQSAGGVSALYLMSVEPSRGLIDRVISQSGFMLYPAYSADQASQRGAAYFAAKGITGDSADTLAKMRAVPWDQLHERMNVGETQPIIDGRLITMDTGAAFSQGRQLKVPLMLGGNSNEASLWRTADPAARLARLGTIPAQYREDGADAARIISRMVTDLYMTQPDRDGARWHTRSGQPTWRYYFSYVPPAQRAGSLGLAHGAELNYVAMRPAALADPQDAATSTAALAYWVAFAKYGTPGAAGGVNWPRYDAASESVLDFSVGGPVVRTHLYDARLDWVRDNRDRIFATAEQGVAPSGTPYPAKEGPRSWIVPSGTGWAPR